MLLEDGPGDLGYFGGLLCVVGYGVFGYFRVATALIYYRLGGLLWCCRISVWALRFRVFWGWCAMEFREGLVILVF